MIREQRVFEEIGVRREKPAYKNGWEDGRFGLTRTFLENRTSRDGRAITRGWRTTGATATGGESARCWRKGTLPDSGLRFFSASFTRGCVERLSEKPGSHLQGSSRDRRGETFWPFWPSYTHQMHARSVARTPFRTVSEGVFSEVRVAPVLSSLPSWSVSARLSAVFPKGDRRECDIRGM
jgi:hypothetical protein